MTSQIRPLRTADYPFVISVIDQWWGGRQMADKLPRLFFEHFTDTSFAAERDGKLAGFLAGFMSQSRPGEAYIHFVGVDPAERGSGLGRLLYEAFFQAAEARGCILVRAITSPVNRGSVAFHQRMGFQLEPGDAEVDGIPVSSGYDGQGGDRVRFIRSLRGTPSLWAAAHAVDEVIHVDVPFSAPCRHVFAINQVGQVMQGLFGHLS